jgi:hypothetical protein
VSTAATAATTFFICLPFPSAGPRCAGRGTG